jgi:hypothetical protein
MYGGVAWAGPEGILIVAHGPDARDLARRAPSYLDRILRGAKPSELPIQFPTKFELVVNFKTAKAIVVTIPETLPRPSRRGDRTKRREFIAGLGSAAAWPVVAWAQQGERMRRIGVLGYGDENDPLTTCGSPEAGAVPLGPKGGRGHNGSRRMTPSGADRSRSATHAGTPGLDAQRFQKAPVKPFITAGLQQCDKIRVWGPSFALTEWPRIDLKCDPDLGGWGAEERSGPCSSRNEQRYSTTLWPKRKMNIW